jgi:hypothetical protein
MSQVSSVFPPSGVLPAVRPDRAAQPEADLVPIHVLESRVHASLFDVSLLHYRLCHYIYQVPHGRLRIKGESLNYIFTHMYYISYTHCFTSYNTHLLYIFIPIDSRGIHSWFSL